MFISIPQVLVVDLDTHEPEIDVDVVAFMNKKYISHTQSSEILSSFYEGIMNRLDDILTEEAIIEKEKKYHELAMGPALQKFIPNPF